MPAEKLSTNRTVLCSRGTVVPPDFGEEEVKQISIKGAYESVSSFRSQMNTLTVTRTIGLSLCDSVKFLTEALTSSKLDGLVSSSRNRSISLQMSFRLLFSFIAELTVFVRSGNQEKYPIEPDFDTGQRALQLIPKYKKKKEKRKSASTFTGLKAYEH